MKGADSTRMRFVAVVAQFFVDGFFVAKMPVVDCPVQIGNRHIGDGFAGRQVLTQGLYLVIVIYIARFRKQPLNDLIYMPGHRIECTLNHGIMRIIKLAEVGGFFGF